MPRVVPLAIVRVMRVTCPNCGAAYNVPEIKLAAAARRLRCARCAHEWVIDLPDAADSAPAAPLDAPAPAASATPAPPPSQDPPPAVVEPPAAPAEPAPVSSLDHPASPPPRPLSPALLMKPRLAADRPLTDATRATRHEPSAALLGAAWALSVAVVGLSLAAAVIWRADVVRAWPASERAYNVVGLR